MFRIYELVQLVSGLVSVIQPREAAFLLARASHSCLLIDAEIRYRFFFNHENQITNVRSREIESSLSLSLSLSLTCLASPVAMAFEIVPPDYVPEFPPEFVERSEIGYTAAENKDWKDVVRRERAKRFRDVRSELPSPPKNLRVQTLRKQERRENQEKRGIQTSALVEAQLQRAFGSVASYVEGRYIVVLREDYFPYILRDASGKTTDLVSRSGKTLPLVADEMAKKAGGRSLRAWSHALSGFSAELTKEQAATLSKDPRVLSIAQDQYEFLNVEQLSPANWGLDRIDEDNVSNENVYRYKYNGTGVSIYLIDTGINSEHEDFTGRLGVGYRVGYENIDGYDDVEEEEVQPDDYGASDAVEDENGHGSHVAGIAAGTIHGVAKGALIHPVKKGPMTNHTISAIDWIVSHHQANTPAVVNMSIGHWRKNSDSKGIEYRQAINNLIADGVVVVAAVGNDSKDVIQTSSVYLPGGMPEVISVGASNPDDAMRASSNYGEEIDLFAPGTNIVSAARTGQQATATKNGTSMAAPHVAGVAALYLQHNPTASHADVEQWLMDNARLDKIGLSKDAIDAGTPNRLLHSHSWWYPLHSIEEYLNSDSPKDDFWFQREEIGRWEAGYFLYTNESLYPLVWRLSDWYDASQGEWLYFYDTENHWWFYSYSTQEWLVVWQ